MDFAFLDLLNATTSNETIHSTESMNESAVNSTGSRDVRKSALDFLLPARDFVHPGDAVESYDMTWMLYIASGFVILATIALVIVGVLAYWELNRRKASKSPDNSVIAFRDSWDNVSLHYIDNPARESLEEVDNDSYLFSLEQLMFAQRQYHPPPVGLLTFAPPDPRHMTVY